jgi:hypothetical protein
MLVVANDAHPVIRSSIQKLCTVAVKNSSGQRSQHEVIPPLMTNPDSCLDSRSNVRQSEGVGMVTGRGEWSLLVLFLHVCGRGAGSLANTFPLVCTMGPV